MKDIYIRLSAKYFKAEICYINRTEWIKITDVNGNVMYTSNPVKLEATPSSLTRTFRLKRETNQNDLS